MDRETRRLVEEFRRNDASPIENNLIDELVAGEWIARSSSGARPSSASARARSGCCFRYIGEEPAFGGTLAPAKVGGTLRVGSVAYNSSLEPYGLREAGSLGLAGIPGEYLTYTNNKLQVRPWLATSWKPNKALTVWTFQIRRGVKFHNGKTLNADDVVASIRQYLSVKDSQALGALPASMIGPEGVVKTGPYTVQFRLKQPNNAFPYLAQPDDVPGDHPAGGDRREAGNLGVERHDRDRRVPPEEPEQAARRARALPQLLGRQGLRSTRS